MTITVLEYKRVDEVTGEPLEPPDLRTINAPLDTAFSLQANTAVARVIAVAACYLRVSFAGTAATDDDLKLLAGDSVEFRARIEAGSGRPVQVYPLTVS